MATLLRLGHSNGNVTTVGFNYEPDHTDLAVLRDADHGTLNEHSQRQRTWLLSLPDHHQPYWTHIMEVDHLWPTHGEQPPAWVSCPDHPDLEAALSEHFTARGHTCRILPAGEDAGEVS